ncbi:hypothetical protein WJX72_002046 [[Myrmecia] bisecta]|uniref:Uncharacterized protein n=1 Tax=[Myrmecia] bisecta TaxID=41462 RepID=A0AAW1PAN0_9CHLO
MLEHFAATYIQAHYRAYRAKRKYHILVSAVVCLQHKWRRFRRRRCVRHAAAATIQGVWRSQANRRIFHFYRQLIADLRNFRPQGYPQALLKSINPREAALLDAASAVHVRFRLGGATFPPMVYYKIFTHSAVTDICSFCPRNYVAEGRRSVPSRNTSSTVGREDCLHRSEDGCCTASSNAERLDPAEELLEWSAALDFDEYMRDWSVIGCSASSACAVPFLDTANDAFDMSYTLPAKYQDGFAGLMYVPSSQSAGLLAA